MGVTPYSPRSELEPVYSPGSDAWDWTALGCEFCQPDFQGDHFFAHRSPGGGRVHCITLINRWSQFNLLATELGRFYLVTPGPRGERRHRKALHQPRRYDPLMNLQRTRKRESKKKKIIPVSVRVKVLLSSQLIIDFLSSVFSVSFFPVIPKACCPFPLNQMREDRVEGFIDQFI